MITTTSNNIILIGMPGAGKSTLGRICAKQQNKTFIDTDELIVSSQQNSLQNIVDQQGHNTLRHVEEQELLNLNASNSIIATGGSAVYSDSAMHHLDTLGLIIYLHLPLIIIEQRINNFSTRGLARKPGQSLADLFRERQALYLQWADKQLDLEGLSIRQAAKKLSLLSQTNK